MGRNTKALTQEQIEWRDSILRGRVKRVVKVEPPKPIPRTIEDEINKNFYYLNNCVWWINEYMEGRIDKGRLLETAEAIRGNASELIKILTKKP